MARFVAEANVDQPMASLDVTPMIGVLAALLSLFILSVPVTGMLRIPIAPDESFPSKEPTDLVQIVLSEDGRIFWNGVAVGPDRLQALAQFTARSSAQPSVEVLSSSTVRYQELAFVIDTLQAQGLRFAVGNK